MVNEISVVIGWTAPIDLELQIDGEVADLTGATVEFTVAKSNGERLPIEGTTAVVSAPDGTVRFTPGADDFTVFGVFGARVKVTYASSAVVYFPARVPLRLVVGA